MYVLLVDTNIPHQLPRQDQPPPQKLHPSRAAMVNLNDNSECEIEDTESKQPVSFESQDEDQEERFVGADGEMLDFRYNEGGNGPVPLTPSQTKTDQTDETMELEQQEKKTKGMKFISPRAQQEHATKTTRPVLAVDTRVGSVYGPASRISRTPSEYTPLTSPPHLVSLRQKLAPVEGQSLAPSEEGDWNAMMVQRRNTVTPRNPMSTPPASPAKLPGAPKKIAPVPFTVNALKTAEKSERAEPRISSSTTDGVMLDEVQLVSSSNQFGFNYLCGAHFLVDTNSDLPLIFVSPSNRNMACPASKVVASCTPDFSTSSNIVSARIFVLTYPHNLRKLSNLTTIQPKSP
ncbi:hypothetical protein EK21DRAFT_106433 [Setomelanomma holmii]|uniref:Uncharacterized protein n=1 Tax=Setomelanomma holmii TaxID=210430 RepID=A0A9P4LT63_9PLEO|nr:hypothetical protein EK21DRAFT_106433 [Setomelanomma holmii]